MPRKAPTMIKKHPSIPPTHPGEYLREIVLPAMDLYDRLFPKGYKKVVHEDNTATIQIAVTGMNRTMRWLGRKHGISIQFLYDKLGSPEKEEEITLAYTRSEWMAADVYTKFFGTKSSWLHALELINICKREEVEQMITYIHE